MAIVQGFHGDCKQFSGFEIPGVFVFPLVCPHCKGCLVKHGSYRRKTVVPRVPRMRCKSCRRTTILLPHFLAPWQRTETMKRERVIAAWSVGPAYGVWVMGWL